MTPEAATTRTEKPVLSVCIPTYNRCAGVRRVVDAILRVGPSVEVCVHDDGSQDGTFESLSQTAATDHRLRVGRGPNRGRAFAMRAAFEMATGRFVMFYDDDDEIFEEGLKAALAQLGQPLPERVCGYIFQMRGSADELLGRAFPPRSNFLRLRADEGVVGDKKEVVLRNLLAENFYTLRDAERRVPTSTLWTRLALSYDVICSDVVIGAKTYLAGGYTDRIAALKAQNPRPMARVNLYKAIGFLKGRYRSPAYFARSLAGLLLYSARMVIRPFPAHRSGDAAPAASNPKAAS